ncbi:hypothetical protein H5407_17550 [Mitsuaria sp. WAJ17]|uniref:hypothetical protein n=1 Tax=Mitsuaria sp. WAJ17 TaxID=2761452 RepID=UPI0016008516|nr:hypothetical protein [Mitsuaria sp. WAJ17]MBB2487038.1 hypothetical protein [Mitsuaria sp. WAJ17]
MSPRRYLLALACMAGLIAALFAGFNAWVNPYLLFDTARIPGFNAKKPAVETRERLMKSYEALRRPARTLVIGSSRTDLGLDPAAPAWPEGLRPVYNLSLVGSGTETGLRFAQHMVAGRPASAPVADTLLVGLDFENFLAVPKAAGGPSAATLELEARLLVRPDGQVNDQRMQQVLLDHVAGLLSLDALIDSTHTVLANRRGPQPDLEGNGHLSEGRFQQWAQADGFATLFRQKNVQAMQTLAHRELAGVDGAPLAEPSKIRPLIEFATRHRMKLVLALQPSHASRLDLLAHMGHWPAYEHWKRALCAEVSAARDSGRDVSLWDFGGYEMPMREPVPAPGDRQSRMRWFWDPVHYSAALGDQMIRTMFSQDGAAGDANAPIGVLLTPQNLDARLQQVRADQQRYRTEQPAAAAATRQLVCSTSKRC